MTQKAGTILHQESKFGEANTTFQIMLPAKRSMAKRIPET